MTVHVRAAENGSFVLPEELVQQIGAGPGDLLAIDREGEVLVLRVESQGSADPLTRLRAALRGYSVAQFLAERRADMGQ